MLPTGRAYMLTRVALDEYVQRLLARAAAGATKQDIAAAIVDDTISQAEAEEFTDSLIDAQLLVSQLSVPITGEDVLQSLIDAVTEIAAGDSDAGEHLSAIQLQLEALNQLPIGAPISEYRTVMAGLERLGIPIAEERLFQVDMRHSGGGAMLERAICDDIAEATRALWAFLPKSDSPSVRALGRFKQLFEQRYEKQQIPLVEALDADTGIGFPPGAELAADASPLLAGVPFGGSNETPLLPWSNREWRLARKLKDAGTAFEIHLTKADVDALAPETTAGPIPSSFAMMARLARTPAGDMLIAMHGGGGPSGAVLLGRFCQNDSRLADCVRALIAQEESDRPDAIFAEIAHVPEGRDGNVILRPMLRRREIPYLARSTARAEDQIEISDLLVSVTEDGRIALISRRLQREVLPRLSSAHAVRGTSPPIYQFLNALQQQGVAAQLAWDWGGFESYSFLPRVVYGRTILKLARWRIDKDEYDALTTLQSSALCEYVRDWRTRRGIPRLLGLAEGDNILPVDWENLLSVENLAWMLRRRTHDQIVLTEIFPEPGASPVSSPEGLLQNEVVVPMRVLASGTGPAVLSAPVRPTAAVARYLPPGTEWLYLKCYCGDVLADDLILHVLPSLARPLCAAGVATGWFFIRYGDPEWHVRFRIRVPLATDRDDVRRSLDEALSAELATGRTWRLQYDTYQREIERYAGSQGILLSEELFYLDSETAVDTLVALADHDCLDQRWLLAALRIEELLNALRIPVSQRVVLFNNARDQFLVRYPNGGARLRASLSDKYRDCRRALERVVSGEADAPSLAPAITSARARSDALCDWARHLREAERAQQLDRPVGQLLFSYIHMLLNRMLRSSHQQQELVLYEFLGRLYRSRDARQHVGGLKTSGAAR